MLDQEAASLLIIGGSLLFAGLAVFAVMHSPLLSAAGSAAGTSAEACEKLQSLGAKYNCYRDYLDGIVNSKGAPAAIAELDRLQSAGTGYPYTYCHPLMHAVGRAAYERYKDPETALQYETGICYTGYTHGVMESYMATFADSDLASRMATMCHPDPHHPESLKYYDCVHGIGHGVMLRFDGDVFKSLPYCDKLTTEWEKSACFNGIFMQNVSVDGQNHVSKSLKADDPLYPCDAVEARMMDPCYLIQARHINEYTHQDLAASFRWCGKAAPAVINSCYQSMGTEISGYANGDPGQIIAMCSLGAADYQGFCYGSAAAQIAYRMHDPHQAEPLCASVPARYTKDCRAGLKAFADML